MSTMDVTIMMFKRFREASVAEPVFFTEDEKRFVLVLFLPNFTIRTTLAKNPDKNEDWMFYMRELYSHTCHRVLAFHGIADKENPVIIQKVDEVIANPKKELDNGKEV